MRHPHAVPAMHHRRCTIHRDMMTMIETKTTTSEMTKSEMNKTNETKHEASGCARELHELRAPRTANPRDQETESRTKNPSTTGRSCAHPFLQEPGVADLGTRGREGDAEEGAHLGARRGEGDHRADEFAGGGGAVHHEHQEPVCRSRRAHGRGGGHGGYWLLRPDERVARGRHRLRRQHRRQDERVRACPPQVVPAQLDNVHVPGALAE